MNEASYFSQQALHLICNYQPIVTEFNGIKDVVKGVAGLAYATMWRLVDSEDLGTGTPVATQAIQLSSVVLAEGIAKLTLPIIFSIGYQLCKN